MHAGILAAMTLSGQKPLPPVIIGIAGGTGSGKTTVALRVREASPGKTIRIIHHDSYYKDNSHLPLAERAQINYDHPNAFETTLLVEHLQQLREGHSVQVPQYDYAIHSRLKETSLVEPADIVFVEGILVLEAPELRSLMDIRLYIDVDADERVLRRMKRDVLKRGRTMESVMKQYLSVVRPMHLRHVHRSEVMTEVLDAKAIVVGSPTLNNGVFPTVSDFLTYMKGLKPQHKLGAAFGSYGWSGEAVKHIQQALEAMHFEMITPGLRLQYVPDQKGREASFELGQTVGRAVAQNR